MMNGNAKAARMINAIRKMFEEREFHVVVEKGKIWLYFWKERAGSKRLEKLPFDCWAEAWRFVKAVEISS